ncbi:hypothetical protein Vretifemale_9191 [Volvox reticuliferus]|uniref:Vacuolar ATPase assembly protein VMA22 n=1 Tax=Volvox reticuliferus TaxID=1737510 RepID=A0A8J4CE48_9CHLO|nr:hypothetical protein Vretifemale_9191 [Volvox reticuliferus]
MLSLSSSSSHARQEYLQLQARLQDQLKKGLMNLARAKYSMGPIGQAQYDMEMQASVRVAIKSGDENGGSSGGGGGAVEGAGFRLCGMAAVLLGETEGECDPYPCPRVCVCVLNRTYLYIRTSSGWLAGLIRTSSGANAPCSGTRYSFEIRKSPNAATARRPSPPPAAAAATMDRAKAAAEATPAAAAAVAEARGSKNVADEVAAADSVVRLSDLDLLDDDDGSGEDGGLSGEGGKEEEDEKELKVANEFLRRMRLLLGSDGGDGGGDGGSEGGDVAEVEWIRRVRRGGRNGGGGSDPLHWFGVLVPPALKDAQSGFSAALETCLLLANTAQRMGPLYHATSSAGAAEEGAAT